jgi:RHS repeat-associated protein
MPGRQCRPGVSFTKRWLRRATTLAAGTYYPNGMINQISHANGVIVNHDKDPYDMPRPRRIYTTLGASNWDSGTFQYDGAGNIVAMRGIVEPFSRTGATKQQYAFDAFGNLTSITRGGSTYPISVDSSTNRINNPVTYDGAGNMTSWGGYSYGWYSFSDLRSLQGPGLLPNLLFAYDAGGERDAIYDSNAGTYTYTLRGLDGKVLREYRVVGGTWSWSKDYVYREGQLLAAVDSAGTRHFHLDHLGSPRLITDSNGNLLEYHAFWAYGGEVGTAGSCDERMKFTGHERDNQCSAGILDYMHARYFSPTTGRFLSVDQGNGKPEVPQSWNRYAYARANPVRRVDPDGLADREVVVTIPVNVIFSEADYPLSAPTVRAKTEMAIAFAGPLFAREGIQLDIGRFEAGTLWSADTNRLINGPVHTPARGDVSWNEFVAVTKGRELNVLAAGRANLRGGSEGLFGNSVLGALQTKGDLAHELSHSLGYLFAKGGPSYWAGEIRLSPSILQLLGLPSVVKENATLFGCKESQPCMHQFLTPLPSTPKQ